MELGTLEKEDSIHVALEKPSSCAWLWVRNTHTSVNSSSPVLCNEAHEARWFSRVNFGGFMPCFVIGTIEEEVDNAYMFLWVKRLLFAASLLASDSSTILCSRDRILESIALII